MASSEGNFPDNAFYNFTGYTITQSKLPSEGLVAEVCRMRSGRVPRRGSVHISRNTAVTQAGRRAACTKIAAHQRGP